MDEQIAFAGSAELARRLRSREVSSRELVELYLSRIERLEPRLNAYRVVLAQSAMAQATECDRRIAAGEEAPLLGVPLAIKDVEDMAGEVTTLGTGGFDEPAAEDSRMVASLRAAGAVFLGKTNLPELAISGFTESKTWGTTRNPWDTDRTPSGSSGGSAVAVAAGLCAAASASDGAGSIRNPAAFCGLFGLKPQRDRVPLNEADHWLGLSVTGCITRSVEDTALWLDVTMARGGGDEVPPPPSRPYVDAARVRPARLRVALSTKPARFFSPPATFGRPIVTDEVKRAVAETGELLRSLGHAVHEEDPDYRFAADNFVPRYLGGIHGDVETVPHPKRLDSRTRGYGRLGSLYPGAALRRAQRVGASDAERINRIFDRCDVLVTPVVGELPFQVERWEGRSALRTMAAEGRRFCFAPVWNHTGQPAAAVPAGLSAEGLPRSVQLVGRPNDEETLLSLAAEIEAERPWADRLPPVS